jgi:hypothetical protein
MSKRVLLLSLVLAAAVLAPQWRDKHRPPLGAFTATQIEAIYEAGDPVVTLTRTTTLAVRSDGSFAELFPFRDPSGAVKPLFRRAITDVSARRYLFVEPFSESVSTFPQSPWATAEFAKKYRGTCNGPKAGEVLGYDVLVVESTVQPTEAEKVVTRSWLAPQLYCLPLREELQFFFDGRFSQRTVKSVVSLTEGEPPAWIFEVPANYRERSPSAAMAEAARRYPNEECCKNAGTDDYSAQDDAYFFAQKQNW